LTWTDQHGISLTVSILQHPEYLSISVLPVDLFDSITDKLDQSNLKIQKQINNEMTEVIDMHNFVNFLKANYKFSLQKQQQFKEFLDWYDCEQEWKQILPSFNSVIEFF